MLYCGGKMKNRELVTGDPVFEFANTGTTD